MAENLRAVEQTPRDVSLIAFELEIDRADIATNGLPPPERWSLETAAEADRLGLIYAFEVTIRDGVR